MYHCSEFAVETEDAFTMTIDEAFAVTKVTCDMMTVAGLGERLYLIFVTDLFEKFYPSLADSE